MHLLLLPGMDGTGRLFEPLVRALPPGLTPIVMRYSPDQPLGYAELLPLVERAAPQDADYIVLAESFSGPLALQLAAQHPPRLRGVVLCASFARNPLPGFTRWLGPLVRGLWFRLTPNFVCRKFLLGRYRTPELDALLDAVWREVRPGVLAARAREILAVDATQAAQACAVPILYLAGAADRIVGPRSHEYLRAQAPQLEIATLPGPHLLLQAAPAAAVPALVKFADACSRAAVVAI